MKILPFTLVSIICILFTLLCLSIANMDGNLQGKNSDITVKTIGVGNGYGYEILENSHLIIKQEYIPVLTGNQYFCTEKDAKVVGEIIKSKIVNKESPSISYKELVASKISLNCPQNIQNDPVP